MILTEHLLNADSGPQTSKRARKSPCNWVRQKKNREEGIRTGPVALGGSCERGKVSLLAGRSVGTEGDLRSLRAWWQVCRGQSKESPARSVGAERHTLTSNAPTKGAGYWGSSLRSGLGRGLWLAARRQQASLRASTRVWCATTKGAQKEVWDHQWGKEPLLGAMWREGQAHHRSLYLCTCSQASGGHLHELHGQAWATTAM